MIVEEINLYKYTIPLSKPFNVKGKLIEQREGLIIEFKCGAHYGFGEIAPLQNFNVETLEEAVKQTATIKNHFLNDEIPEKVYELNGGLDKWLGKYQLYPSVQFGIETALLNLMAAAKDTSFCELIQKEFHEEVLISGLLQGTSSEINEEAKIMLEEGFLSFKVKAGKSIDADIKMVNALKPIVEGKALVHIDANQKWTIEEAESFVQNVGLTCVDYIEEPFKDLNHVSEFYDHSLMPIAVDESLHHNSFDTIQSISGIEMIVLKPTVIGGIDKVWQIITQSKKHAFRCIISSSFETSIGLHTLVNLAACLQRDNPAGLDTLKFLKDDIVYCPLTTSHGKITIADRPIKAEDINFNKLEKVSL